MSEAKKLEKIRVALLERKQELEQEMVKSYQEKFSDGQVEDAGDQALSSTMESLKSSVHDTKRSEYKRVEKALAMLEDGTYGICVDCNKEISEKRLNSFPNAARCLVCQEAFEEGEEL